MQGLWATGRTTRPGFSSAAPPDAVTQVKDVLGRVAEVAGADLPYELELDVLGAEVVEQPPAAAEKDRHHVQLEVVELTGRQQRLRRARAEHADGSVTHGGAGQRRALRHVGHELDRARRRSPRGVPGQHEDGRAVVVVAVPVARQLVGAAADTNARVASCSA